MWGGFIKLCIGVLVSFYFFPVEFVFLPGHNTKKLLAAIGLVFLGYNYIKNRSQLLTKDFLTVSAYAALVSIVGLFSITFNNTPDMTYASYIMSMWVWLGGAYAVVSIMRFYHKTVTFELVCYYLMGVCVAQCIIALAIDMSPVIKSYVDRFFVTTLMDDVKRRLYGIGCALDVAGTRFSAVLIMISSLLAIRGRKMQRTRLLVCVLCFLVISVLGNMIARTTIIGVFISLLLIFIKSLSSEIGGQRQRVIRWVTLTVLLLLPVVIYYYDSNPQMRENLRFAFEGFFSLAEKGEWDVHSNNRLMDMIVFPETLKTWVIGDGYFEGPTNIDPYYVGPSMTGFYMWTDIGYLRFIFYFGVIGLVTFMLFFLKSTQLCVANFRDYSTCFWLLLILNFIIWFKVATDIFVVFALFLCFSPDDMEDASVIEG